MEEHYCQLLGLQKGASLEEIKKAYKKYAAKFHPDKHEGDIFFKEQFQRIREAYEYLINHAGENKYETNNKVEIIYFNSDKSDCYQYEIINVSWNVQNAKEIVLVIKTTNKENCIENLPAKGTHQVQFIYNDNIRMILNCLGYDNNVTRKSLFVRNKYNPNTYKATGLQNGILWFFVVMMVIAAITAIARFLFNLF